MSKLYVANVSKHHHVFSCRLPERTKLWEQKIRAMSQVQIAGDMTPEGIASIIDQRRRYGLPHWSEARKSREFVGLCYSIDTPINIKTFFEVNETNGAALNARSDEIHEQAAAAMVEKLESDLGKPVQRAEVEMIEDRKNGTPKVSRGVEIVREGIQPRHEGARKTRVMR